MTVHQHDLFNTDLQGILDADGHRWFGKFKVLTKCGTLIDTSNKKKPYRPQITEYKCLWCSEAFWRCKYKTTGQFCSKACSANYATMTKRVQAYLDNPMDHCFNCGVWFRPGNTKEGGKSICCSTECGHEFRVWANEISNPWRDTETCSVTFNNCTECGVLFTADHARKTICSDECRAESKRKNAQAQRGSRRKRGLDHRGRHRKRHAKYGTKYDNKITAKAVAERDNHTCQMCFDRVEPHLGKGWQPRGWSIGHIVPVSMKGETVWSNVQCECIECNTMKGARVA